MALAGVLQPERAKGGAHPEENRSPLAHSSAHQACQNRGWGAALEDMHLWRRDRRPQILHPADTPALSPGPPAGATPALGIPGRSSLHAVSEKCNTIN